MTQSGVSTAAAPVPLLPSPEEEGDVQNPDRAVRESENLTRSEARRLAAEVDSFKKAPKASGTSSIAGGWNGADEKQILGVGGTQIVKKVRESILRSEMSYAGSSVNFLSSSIYRNLDQERDKNFKQKRFP